MDAAGVGNQTGLCSGTQGQQVADFLHRPLQAAGLDVLGKHFRRHLEHHEQRSLVLGKRRGFLLPGRPGQGENPGQPQQAKGQHRPESAAAFLPTDDQVLQQARRDDVLPALQRVLPFYDGDDDQGGRQQQ